MNKHPSHKAMALLYVIVTIGVLSLAFVSMTEIGKSKNIQVSMGTAKTRAYDAVDIASECAMNIERKNDIWPTSGLTCNGNPIATYFPGGSSKVRVLGILVDPAIGNCAEVIMHYDQNSTSLGGTDGYSDTVMIVRGFSACKQSGGRMVAPLFNDPTFSTVVEKTYYRDFPI